MCVSEKLQKPKLRASKWEFKQVFVSQGLGVSARSLFQEEEGRNIEDDYFFSENDLIVFYLLPVTKPF